MWHDIIASTRNNQGRKQQLPITTTTTGHRGWVIANNKKLCIVHVRPFFHFSPGGWSQCLRQICNGTAPILWYKQEILHARQCSMYPAVVGLTRHTCIAPLTSDAPRPSQRATVVTVLRPKLADLLLVNKCKLSRPCVSECCVLCRHQSLLGLRTKANSCIISVS